MKTITRLFVTGALLVLATVGLCASPAMAQEEKNLEFVLVSHAPDSDTWWNTVKNAIDEAGEEMGVTVKYRNPSTGDLAQMARLIEQAVASRPDGIITTIADYGVLEGPIEDAIRRGIPVITINSGTEEQSEQLGALMHVGQPEAYAGRLAGERAKEAGVSNFLCVNHYITNPASVERCRGFAEGLGVELGDQMLDTGGTDPTEVRSKVEAYLRKSPDTEAILALGPASANPTIEVVREMGKEDIYFATFDISPQIVQAIKDGVIQFAIDQQPYLQGYLPVVLLTKYNQYGLMPANNIRSGPGFITTENVELVEELAGRIR